MEEAKTRSLMSEEELKRYLKNPVEELYENNTLYLRNFYGVSRFKSIRRAIRRGQAHIDGTIYPRRPFNNRSPRKVNELKKQIYGQLRKTT